VHFKRYTYENVASALAYVLLGSAVTK